MKKVSVRLSMDKEVLKSIKDDNDMYVINWEGDVCKYIPTSDDLVFTSQSMQSAMETLKAVIKLNKNLFTIINIKTHG